MPKLKFSASDLSRIFKQIEIKHITESLCSFDNFSSIDLISKFMQKQDYDVVGIRLNGEISGYVHKKDLEKNKEIKDCIKEFSSADCILSSEQSIEDCLACFKTAERIFVITYNKIDGIITRGDLRKIPVRLFIFSAISNIEMNMLEIIKIHHTDDTLREHLRNNNIGFSEKFYSHLRKENEYICLAETLSFHKKCIVGSCLNHNWQRLFNKNITLEEYKVFLRDLNRLRNKIAHAQNYIHSGTKAFIELVQDTLKFMANLEECLDEYRSGVRKMI